MHDYYLSVSQGFWVELQHQISIVPKYTADRNKLISNQLKKINAILAKLDQHIAYGMYKGLLGLAEEVSKASGGFLRMGAESASEHEWVKLPMLTPIAEPEGAKEDAGRFDEKIWGEKNDV